MLVDRSDSPFHAARAEFASARHAPTSTRERARRAWAGRSRAELGAHGISTGSVYKEIEAWDSAPQPRKQLPRDHQAVPGSTVCQHLHRRSKHRKSRHGTRCHRRNQTVPRPTGINGVSAPPPAQPRIAAPLTSCHDTLIMETQHHRSPVRASFAREGGSDPGGCVSRSFGNTALRTQEGSTNDL